MSLLFQQVLFRVENSIHKNARIDKNYCINLLGLFLKLTTRLTLKM